MVYRCNFLYFVIYHPQAIEETNCGQFKAIRVQVRGHAYYAGKSTFTVEEDDPLMNGFLLR